MSFDSELKEVRGAFSCGNVFWRVHALERMFERGISRAGVSAVIEQGEVIEVDRDRHPFPTCLVFGRIGEDPIHIVIGLDSATSAAYVVTVYVPDTEHFEADLRTRKSL